MTATAFLDLKQRACKLSERERQELSAYLIRMEAQRDSTYLAGRFNALYKSPSQGIPFVFHLERGSGPQSDLEPCSRGRRERSAEFSVQQRAIEAHLIIAAAPNKAPEPTT